MTSLVAATVALEMPRASGALVASGGALVLQQLMAGCQDWTQVLVATEALDEHLGELLRMGFYRMVAAPAILRLQELGWKAEMEKVLDEVLETRFSARKSKVLGHVGTVLGQTPVVITKGDQRRRFPGPCGKYHLHVH